MLTFPFYIFIQTREARRSWIRIIRSSWQIGDTTPSGTVPKTVQLTFMEHCGKHATMEGGQPLPKEKGFNYQFEYFKHPTKYILQIMIMTIIIIYNLHWS